MNEDGKMAVIVMNQSNLKITYNLCIGHNAAEVKILPHSIQTLVL
jgi:glucosylceramidase